MHGTVLNFDNITVATKAWNMLFAVMDWATAKTKAETPKPPEKGWGAVIRQIVENANDKKLLDGWAPYTLTKTDAGFEEDLAFIACTDYLEAWKARNYGKISKHLSRLVAHNHGNALPNSCATTTHPMF